MISKPEVMQYFFCDHFTKDHHKHCRYLGLNIFCSGVFRILNTDNRMMAPLIFALTKKDRSKYIICGTLNFYLKFFKVVH